MRIWNRFVIALVLLTSFAWLIGWPAPQLYAEGAGRSNAETGIAAASTTYLPLIFKSFQFVPARRVNAPYFNDSLNVTGSHFPEMAIFWFGKVSQTENYADVRVGYNNTDLYVYLAAFDRRLWYDTSPSVADLTAWDAATLYLNLTGNTGDSPSTNAYRLDAQFSPCLPSSPTCLAPYRAAYRGNGSGWGSAATAFTEVPGWRGDYPNNDIDDRGWAMTYQIPFASLGLSGPPAQGTVWGMAVVMHDRDSAAGSPAIADKTWPEANVDALRPVTWGKLGFGLPTYSPPGYSSSQTVTIRQGLNGTIVPDAGVGGTTGNLCPGDTNFIWNQWGNVNFGDATDFNIQNQSDVSDWPCFSKYYVTFPLNAIPASKVIASATLTLYQFGNAGNPGQALPSLIQVSTVAEDWNEATITWNNAPLALENVSQAWVNPAPPGCGGSVSWPCFPRTWDVSRAVAQAYANGQPLRLALYEADSAQHSGKYFTSSQTGDWNPVGRPTLQVVWGNP
jgi:hypothetical protein